MLTGIEPIFLFTNADYYINKVSLFAPKFISLFCLFHLNFNYHMIFPSCKCNKLWGKFKRVGVVMFHSLMS